MARAHRARGERQQRRERNGEVIGVALFETQRTGPDVQHQLEEPGAGNGGGSGDRNGGRDESRILQKVGRPPLQGDIARHAVFSVGVVLARRPRAVDSAEDHRRLTASRRPL